MFRALLLTLAPLLTAPAVEPETRSVSLYLTVEQEDQLVLGLGERNFRLYEDGEALEFVLGEPERPASVALLVEHSESSWAYYSDIQSAVRGFLREAPEGHWYSLATFSHNLQIVQDFTKMRGKIAAAYSELGRPLWNEIDTYDAVYEMLDKLGRLRGRKVLLLIGSGFDGLSEHTLDDVKRKVEETGATIFVMGAGSSLRGRYEPYLGQSERMSLLQAEAFLRMLAERSGGHAWLPRFETAYGEAMKGVFQLMEHSYRLVYERPARRDGKFHEIEVEAYRLEDDQRTDYRVRVRAGWRD